MNVSRDLSCLSLCGVHDLLPVDPLFNHQELGMARKKASVDNGVPHGTSKCGMCPMRYSLPSNPTCVNTAGVFNWLLAWMFPSLLASGRCHTVLEEHHRARDTLVAMAWPQLSAPQLQRLNLKL